MMGNDRDPAPARRRIWCEMLPYEALRTPRTLGLLKRFDIDPIVAVRPWDLGDLARTVGALANAGVRVALWPMMADADGRWANACNAHAFVAFARHVVDSCDAARVPLAEVAFDLEPAIADAEALLDHTTPRRIFRTVQRHHGAFASGRRVLLDGVLEMRARGLDVSCALVPPVLFDRGRESDTWQRALGTPAHLPWSHASVMAYTSMLEGWSRGLVSRRGARWLLGAICRGAKARFGTTAGISLGAVGTGAFEREPVYRDARELADDVAIARGAGIDTVTLFDLAGVLARPPAEAWLEAFVGA